MTRRENQIFVFGLTLGLIVAMIAGGVWQHFRRSIGESTSPTSLVETAANSDNGTSRGASGAVQLSPEEQAKIGLQTATIQKETLNEDVPAIGRVEEAETSIAIVSTRYGGRIEKLFINFAGQPVKAGDPVATIAITNPPTATNDPAVSGRITVNATASGIVRERKVTEGQFINAGDPLIELTDLKSVWVKANIFDAVLSKIRPGLAATITSDALPKRNLPGRVAHIDTHSDPQTRTTSVRIEVENPDMQLKPGMIVQSTVHIGRGAMLTVPRNAVLDNGTEKMVYVARENGVFESKNIQVGEPDKESYPVLGGLKAGDRVVTNGVFLVDSQSRLTGGLTGMFGGSKSFSDSQPSEIPAGNGIKMTFRIEPDPPAGAKENRIHVSLLDPSGKPITDAQVRLTFVMPAMPTMNMPEMRNGADLKWTGSEYSGPVQIMMSGGWNVSLEARRGSDVLAVLQTHVNAR